VEGTHKCWKSWCPKIVSPPTSKKWGNFPFFQTARKTPSKPKGRIVTSATSRTGEYPCISTWVNGLKVPGKVLSFLTYLFSPSCFVSKPHLFTKLPTYIQIANYYYFFSLCKKLARQKVRCQNTLRPQNNCFNAWVPKLTPTCSILGWDEGLQVQIYHGLPITSNIRPPSRT